MTAVLGAARPASPTQLDRDNPWPGLDSYDESSNEFFSGRALEADDLLRRILDEPVTVLFGKSGLGKTSLLNAGVFPRLRDKDLLPIFVRLQIRLTSAPLIEQVRRSLFDELKAEGIEHTECGASETLWEWLHRADQELWTRQNRLVRPVFVFDQFEELFTLGAAAPADVVAFREDLADLAENRIPAAAAMRFEQRAASEPRLDVQAMPYKIVLALREDFLADLEGWRQTMPSLRRNRMRLLPMGSEQALQAVCNERTNHLVPEALGRRIVAFLSSGSRPADGAIADDASGPTVEPALLSLFCRGVNEHRKRDGKTAFDEALLEGGKDTIVADFYRSSLADMPDRVNRFIEENLVTEHGYRNSYSVEDAVGSKAVTAKELEALINRHLLRHEHHLGIERVELTHDLLTKAVVEARGGRRLAERDDRDRRRRWKRVRLVAVAAVLLIVPVFALLAIRASRAETRAKFERDRSRSRELAAVARSKVEVEPKLSIALALEGLNLADTAEARSAVLDAARYVWPTAALSKEDLGGDPVAVALNADGSRLAVVAGGTRITLWDVTTRPPTEIWKEKRDLAGSTSVAFSPDQKVLVIARLNAISVLDATTGGVTFDVPASVSASDQAVAVSPDGRWLGWKQESGTIALMDFEQPKLPPVEVDVDNATGFALVGGDKIVTVNNQRGLVAEVLTRGTQGWTREKFDLSACTTPQSVSPGTRYLAATWKGLRCTFMMDAQGLPEKEPVERHTRDMVWDTEGRAFAELLETGELIVGRADRSNHPENSLKGEDGIAKQSDLTRLLSVSESATRLAFIDADEHSLVKIFSLRTHKPFLTGFPSSSFAVAPNGEWFVLKSLDVPPTRMVDIVPIGAEFSTNSLSRPRRIALESVPTSISASADSIVAVFDTTPPTTVVYDVATGQPRYKAVQGEGEGELLGTAGELLLFRMTGRIIRTRDGSPVLSWHDAQHDPSSSTAIVSANRSAVAILHAPKGKSMTAMLYSIDGATLTKTGELLALPDIDSLTFDGGLDPLLLANDGKTLVLAEKGGRLAYAVNGGTQAGAAAPRPVAALLMALSPTGQFELHREAANVAAGTQEIDLVRVRGAARAVVRHLEKVEGYRFSNDDKWLAVWGEQGMLTVDTSTGLTVLRLTETSVDSVDFLGRNTLLSVRLRNETRLIPLDKELVKRFATWLGPRPLTSAERCLYDLGTDCR